MFDLYLVIQGVKTGRESDKTRGAGVPQELGPSKARRIGLRCVIGGRATLPKTPMCLSPLSVPQFCILQSQVQPQTEPYDNSEAGRFVSEPTLLKP